MKSHTAVDSAKSAMESMRARNPSGGSSGMVLVGVAAVLGGLALVAVANGDFASAAVFVPLMLISAAIATVMRRDSRRALREDVNVVMWVFVIFAVVFLVQQDWTLLSAAAGVVVACSGVRLR